MIILENQRLGEVVSNLERWYNVSINFENDTLANKQISGTIEKNKPIDQILTVFEKLYDLKYDMKVYANKRSEITIRKPAK
ncbi:DUF4974 domain-containing protein [Puteibacter caeruleilacunae]|nr:DUF4974 domain-containing protein [Puteibacter caeruleilacunae]